MKKISLDRDRSQGTKRSTFAFSVEIRRYEQNVYTFVSVRMRILCLAVDIENTSAGRASI